MNQAHISFEVALRWMWFQIFLVFNQQKELAAGNLLRSKLHSKMIGQKECFRETFGSCFIVQILFFQQIVF